MTNKVNKEIVKDSGLRMIEHAEGAGDNPETKDINEAWENE